MTTSRWRSRLRGLLGLLIGSAGLAFVIFRLVEGWPAVSDTLSHGDLTSVLGAVALGLAAMASIGFNWRVLLADLGAPLRAQEALARYFVGQLGKYVPGGIWPIVGRAEMARRSGIDGSTAYLSTLLSLSFTYLAAVMTAAFFFAIGGADTGLPWATWVLLLIPIGLLALHPSVIEKTLGLARRLTRRQLPLQVPPWTRSVMLAVLHIPSWIAISAATHLTLLGVGGSQAFTQVAFATCLSWFLGFIVIGLPGGLGVREAVFASLMVSLEPGVAAAVAIAARLVFVVVDLLGAGVSTAVFAVSHRKTES